MNKTADIAVAAAVIPLLAASSNAVTGLVLALATLLVLAATRISPSAARDAATDADRPSPRLPVRWLFVLVALSGTLACGELFLGAVSQALFIDAGAALPLLATAALAGPGTSVAASETAASFTPGKAAALIFATGSLRELLSGGTLLQSAQQLLDAWMPHVDHAARHLPLATTESDWVLIADSPAGGFLVAGVLVALLRMINKVAI